MILTKQQSELPQEFTDVILSTQSFYRLAAVQMASGPNVNANLEEAAKLISLAAKAGARIIALPEYFAIMGLQPSDKVALREKNNGIDGDGPIQRWMKDQARKHNCWLVGGSIPIDCGDATRVRNTTLVYDKTGKQVARYDKIHLFSFDLGKEHYNEADNIQPGSQVVSFNTPYGRVGLSICYDLRFPELYRAMGEVDFILVPSAFTATTGKAHWEPLIRARAIENLAYVIAPAQGGYHVNGRETHGDSMIVDPWGVILDRLPRGSGVVIAGINPQYVKTVRKSLPALSHRTKFN